MEENAGLPKGHIGIEAQIETARGMANVVQWSRGVDTETVWITDEELEARADLVKTMSVAPPRGAGRVRLLRIPGIDLQPCGGTHVRNIAEIAGIKVLKIRSEGKRNRRVEVALAPPRLEAHS